MNTSDLQQLDAAIHRLELHVDDLRLSMSETGTYGAAITLCSKSSSTPVNVR